MADLKQLAREIFLETLAGVDIRRTFAQKVRREGSLLSIDDVKLDLASFRSIRAIAMGKASVPMAQELVEGLSPDFRVEGLVAAPHDSVKEVSGLRSIGANHPVPDEGSFAAARAILNLLAESDSAATLIFFLLSGGSSSLVELPLDSNVPLADVQEVHRVLVHCGASIDEM